MGELEAKEATIKAELREKEAYDMREKVHGMIKLLAERRNKLKVTENVIVKKEMWSIMSTKFSTKKKSELNRRKNKKMNYWLSERNHQSNHQVCSFKKTYFFQLAVNKFQEFFQHKV